MQNLREVIKDIQIEDEMKSSYLTYAMSVIISRALPDARDGLKPSQRRILVAMNDLGLGPRSKFRKCAKIAGDTSGNYHPHGEQVIYPTLVRLAQDFSCRYPLIRGQGNFGSIDGDPPAAMRYTEARMTPFAMEMMEDLNLDTVDFIPNYDETRTEPTVLPAKFPNLLVNGASGIAVGMATSIPPHNLSEVCEGVIKIIDDPDATVDELAKIIKGPDFPTGGIVVGAEGIREGYRSGRGNITLRARVAAETTKGGKKNLIITEIPYQLNKNNIIERIADSVKSGQIQGVADIRDESDKEGMRLVIELKRGEDEATILNQLYKHTQLQSTFSLIFIVLDKGRPVTMDLKGLLVAYKEHRIEVIRRRTAHLLARAEERAHIVEGLRIAVGHIDAIIKIIKTAPDVETARKKLMKRYKLSDRQAEAILQMRLQQLTGLERQKLEDEYEKLLGQIKEYKQILADENLVLDIIREDMYELKDKYGDARRTEIIEASAEFDIEDLIAEETVAVSISHEGYIKRLPLSSYRRQGRGGRGVTGADMKEGDFIEHIFIAGTHDYIMFFTDAGKVHWLKVYDIPQLSRIARGRAIVNILQIPSGENITSMIPVRSFDERHVVMATKNGIVKKTSLMAFKRPQRGGIIAINLDRGDKLIGVKLTRANQELILGTRLGFAIRFPEGQVRSMGRATRGVMGIRLRAGDEVKDLVVLEREKSLLTICENGYGKRTGFDQYRLQKRAGSGIINIKTKPRNGPVVGLKDVRNDDDLILMTARGMVVRISLSGIRLIGRNTQGVRLIKLKAGDKLVSCAVVAADSQQSKTEKEEPPAAAAPTAAEEAQKEAPEKEPSSAAEITVKPLKASKKKPKQKKPAAKRAVKKEKRR